LLPSDTEIAVEGFVPFGGQEGGQVDAVGDVVHGVFGGAELRPEVAADARRHVAMDARDAVLVAEPRIARAVMLKSVLPGSAPRASRRSQVMPVSLSQWEK
jgi:hypothetical protein